jgi:hypothetical protein
MLADASGGPQRGGVTQTVPRYRLRCPAAPRGAGVLLAACMALGSADAAAQSLVNPDPLAPKLQTDAKNPPRFQKFKRQELAQLGPPAAFVPPASGAGKTGFDSTNARKTITAKQYEKLRQSGQPLPSGVAAPLVLSPYDQQPLAQQQSNAESASTASGTPLATTPGAPPVELGPIRRPPKRGKAAEEDPYAPLGVRVGAFDLYPAVELIGGYNTNPANKPEGGAASKLYTVAPELRLQSDWSRHELKADLRGSYTGYSPDGDPTLSRPYFSGTVDGRVDVTKVTHVDLNGRVLISTDNPGNPNLQAGVAKLPVFETYGGNVGIRHQFNRFELGIKGDVERTAYQDSTLVDGTTASNEDRNFDQYTGTLRGSYELMPGVKPYVEASADSRVHDLATDVSGFQRDSKGLTGKVGSTFDLANRLTGEIAVGYTRRSYDDPRFDSLNGVIGNASLIWTATALTTVKLTASSLVGESTIPGVSGILYRAAALQIDHALRRWLIATVKLGFGVNSFESNSDASMSDPDIDRRDLVYEVGFGLTYKLNREVQLKGEYRRDWLHSNIAGNDYTADVFLLGLRLQR